MIKIPYALNLYKPITELVGHIGKKYEDITRIFGNTLWPASRLELALETVPSNPMVSQYTPPQYKDIFYSVARASSNSNSDKTYTIKRIGFDGPIKVAVWRSDGRRILLKKSGINGQRLRDHVSRILKEEQIIASGGELNTIISMLENPH